MSKAKKLYILLGILAALIIAVIAVTQIEEKKEEIKNSGEVILSIDPDSVTALSWSFDDESVSLSRDGDWTWDDDKSFPVDGDKVSAMLEDFSGLSASFVIENVTDYAQYGLKQPECTICITADGTDYEIKLGDFSTVDSERYVSIGDGNVYLVTADPYDDFAVTAQELIANDDVPAFGEVESISFTGEESYKLSRNENGSSLCDDDIYFCGGKSLDTDSVEAYLYSLTYLSLSDYVSYNASEEDLSAYGLDTPALSVSVCYTEDDTEKSFGISFGTVPDGDSAEYYARVEGSELIYTISEDNYNTVLAYTYDDLRHKDLVPVQETDIESIDFTLDGESYTLTREADGDESCWYYNGEEIDAGELINALLSIEAGSFTSEKPSGKTEIAVTVRLNDEADSVLKLVLYRYDGDNCIAAVDGEPTAFVPRSLVVALSEALNEIVLK